ncbi:YggT family protein [Trichocoleus sp. FACHB-90]|jgi:YggT family protein|uniref:YggT family protein n=1 Tax=Cyanophyceae TaxID=3028117 RepID=UPI001687C749|nr:MULTISPECIES: YggT family protein [unclassified Trichocoleus]MBD1834689.1 YggT family protein [Cyanobacteria bacterium FACHB-472]MBD1924839.1 YggT family protein [Trichocoleus sp. FACHB-90]MBD2004857.1 YggT family protein [Trichocoleus sp. FACHB-40]
MNSSADLLINTISTFLNIYVFLLIVRILLTWFPTINWMNQLASTLSPITDPYLNIFRSIVPAMGGLDISPILAILLLQILAQLFGSIQMSPAGF